MEAVQNNFLSKVQDKKFTSLNYWDMLTTLRINSQERRRERYMAIFLWKVCQVSHMDFTGVAGRQGRTDLPKQIVGSFSSLNRKAHESSIGVKGAKIFHLLSDEIRNLDSKNVASDTYNIVK